jgi:uroporphyrinogen-III synthase
MENSKKYLLSTRPLSRSIIEEGARNNIIIEELSFIATRPIRDEVLSEKIKTLASKKLTVVFTSMNAVEAVASQVNQVPDWQIYSIGHTTRQLIEEAWGADKIISTAENAQRLGERMVDDGVTEAVFFCGNIRRDELPNKVRSDGGKVEEVVVYETEDTSVALSKDYDGILFFSPSAVQAFYRKNKPGKNTVLFAIGKTTADVIKQFNGRNIITAVESDKSGLALQAIDYLNKQ